MLLGGCSRAPEVALAPAAAAPVCAAADWPSTVARRRPGSTTDPVAGSVAAWGDPAVVARCGLDPLGPTTDDCVSVDGVDWVVRTLSDGSVATTYGRDPAIEVLAPAAYGPVPLLLPAFSAAVASPLPDERPRLLLLLLTCRPRCHVTCAARSAQAGAAFEGELEELVDERRGRRGPVAAHMRGYIDVGVKPGIVLISLTSTRPSSV